jgi:peptide/nickel transport system permease protein
MFVYILKRLLFFIPTILIISVLTFALSKMTPGDPVRLALGNQDQGEESGGASDKMAGEKAYLAMAEEMGLNLPAFYFQISNKATPDTLYKYVKKPERDNLERLIDMYGNWPRIEEYYSAIKNVDYAILDVKQDSTTFERSRTIKDNCAKLYMEYKDKSVTEYIDEIVTASEGVPALAHVNTEARALQNAYLAVRTAPTIIKTYIPSIKWYGLNNQYHRWLSHFLRFDFGFSYADKRPVWSKMKDALPWTLALNLISIILSYLIAIPIGIASARHKGSLRDRITTIVLFILYSLPSFWIATMLIIFFTTPEYGMNFFPNFGVGDVTPDMSWWDIFLERAYHFILPVFCLTYGSLAYLSRQMRGGILSVFRQDYIRTARAKGIPENKVVWKHAFRNSLIPIITIFASLFPAAISGSFIIENIYSIPGMGQMAYIALVGRDYPIVFAVMMFAAFLTLVGTLVSDILYAMVDPRISFDK